MMKLIKCNHQIINIIAYSKYQIQLLIKLIKKKYCKFHIFSINILQLTTKKLKMMNKIYKQLKLMLISNLILKKNIREVLVKKLDWLIYSIKKLLYKKIILIRIYKKAHNLIKTIIIIQRIMISKFKLLNGLFLKMFLLINALPKNKVKKRILKKK